MADHRYLNSEKVAEKLNLTPGTLANWRWKQQGPPFYRVGGLILYRDEEVDRWIEAGRQSTSDPIAPAKSIAGANQ